jgi:hypothetical protein
MELKETWKKHPLYEAGVVELIPINWLWPYRGSDLINSSDQEGYVDLDKLWSDILTNGLSNPLIIRVGLKNKKFRLEAGNHRIQVLYAHKITHIPATVQVCELCGPDAPKVMTVATHNFDVGDDLLISEFTSEYMKPNAVFKSLGQN